MPAGTGRTDKSPGGEPPFPEWPGRPRRGAGSSGTGRADHQRTMTIYGRRREPRCSSAN